MLVYLGGLFTYLTHNLMYPGWYEETNMNFLIMQSCFSFCNLVVSSQFLPKFMLR